MTADARATAVIAAAGSGRRLGASRPKALVELAGRPLLAWSLDALAGAASIEALVIAAPAGAETEVERVTSDAVGDRLPVKVVPGAETRSRSVAAALEWVEGELVAVHDAARPLVPAALVDDLVARLAADPGAGCVSAAAPVVDTVKLAGEDCVVERTLERSRLWAVQTPQVFRTTALRDAQQREDGALDLASDDAVLVERAGGRVLVHEAPHENLKVTTPLDLELAARLLAARGFASGGPPR